VRRGWSYDVEFVIRLSMTLSIPFGLPRLTLGVLVLQVAIPVAVTSAGGEVPCPARRGGQAGRRIHPHLRSGIASAFSFFRLNFRLDPEARTGTIPATTCSKTREQ
jgi:hypothetical protein